MPRRGAIARILISCGAACLAAAVPARATNGHWQPPDVVPTSGTAAAVFAAYDAYRGSTAPDPARIERFDVTAGTVRTQATAAIRGADFSIQATLGAGTFRSGRAEGRHWRQRPNGVSYRVGADTQGDALDRWPLAILGFDRRDCTLIGETARHAEWVLEDRPAFDSPHWFFVDEATGAIVREDVREGSTVTEFAFGNAVSALGVRRPLQWTVRGGGPDERVAVSSVTAASPPDEVLALPSRGILQAVDEPAQTIELPARFVDDRVFVDVAVDGLRRSYLLDDGTPSIDVEPGDDRRLEAGTMFGHAAIGDLEVGPLRFRHVPATVIDAGLGILGYDFFTSGVVGIDYSHRRLTWTSHAAFVPPPGALALAADFGEAIPLVAMSIGPSEGKRFALDLGSFRVVILRYFTERDGASTSVPAGAPERDTGYLEGGIHAVEAPVARVRFGNVVFRDDDALFEIPNDGVTTDFPIDGIVGVRLLREFDWWFDASTDTVWYRKH